MFSNVEKIIERQHAFKVTVDDRLRYYKNFHCKTLASLATLQGHKSTGVLMKLFVINLKVSIIIVNFFYLLKKYKCASTNNRVLIMNLYDV